MYLSKLFGSKKKENSQPEQTTQKMNKAQIYNLIIVDESGSMSHLRQATLSGINETIDTIKNAQKEFADTQSHFITLVTFDKGVNTNIRYHYNNEPIDNVPTFTNYQPRGCTPLYDTMGQTLTSLYNKINSDENATAVVTVLTDGLENASCKWNAASLRNLINQLKEQGWSFSYMGSAHNVKDVADLLSIDNFMEFSHDNLGAGNIWDLERSSRSAHFKKMHMMYNEGFSSREERTSKLKQYAKEYHGNRVTPEHINHLEPNEVFVFGSNVNGNHNGGAALHALHLFGAIMGQGEGLQGNSYAIPTTGISYDELGEAIYRFTEFAAQHPETHFYVTRIGCGNAGYSVKEVAPHFKRCMLMENVSLPEDFWAILGLKMKF